MYDDLKINILVGKTLRSVREDGNCLVFEVSDAERYRLHHPQDCCESVYLEDINGDLTDLVGTSIIMADEVENDPPTDHEKEDDSETWTFYRISTIKGTVVLRWYGSSNGWYSESVEFDKF